MKAGILDLSLSIPLLLVVVLLSVIGYSVWIQYDTNLIVLRRTGELVDRFHFLLGRYGYVDPCSGNIYPIVDLSSATEGPILLKIGGEDSLSHHSLLPFPVILFYNGELRLAILLVGERYACLLLSY